MNFKDKYNDLLEISGTVPLEHKYNDASDFEKCILTMRLSGYTYGQIQCNLGMPSKKIIRSVLLKWAPETIDNSIQKINKYSKAYSELYNILSKTLNTEWDIGTCYIKDNKILFNESPLEDWSEVEQIQILNSIKSEL